MGSTYKTTNLNLNKWAANDCPKRVDFNYDNEIIDEVLGEHIDDSEKHLSIADREYFASPVSIMTYSGNGNTQRTITVPQCTAVFVYRIGASPVEMAGGNVVHNFCYAGYGHIGSSALVITSKTTISVRNYTSYNGEVINLNTNGEDYVVIAMR